MQTVIESQVACEAVEGPGFWMSFEAYLMWVLANEERGL